MSVTELGFLITINMIDCKRLSVKTLSSKRIIRMTILKYVAEVS
jgi:hypothetical protein